MTTSYKYELQKIFQENSDVHRAKMQAKYMKDHFAFYGLASPKRKKLQAPFLVNKYLPKKHESNAIIKELWQKPQRELQYFSQELAYKYLMQIESKDIDLYEWMIMNKSWWDTVDFIAVNLVGNYFKLFPDKRKIIIRRWMKSENIWLQRTCLIFQLKYKDETDTKILSDCIEKLLSSKEFFICKAIGWALRQYAKTNPDWVREFVKNHPKLSNLSRREALRLL